MAMFSVEQEKFGKYTKIVLKNLINDELIAFIPDFGANIIEMKLHCGDKLCSILDGYDTSLELLTHQYFKNAKLSPFPNRIRDGRYRFNGNDFQLPLNNSVEHHALHGFIWNRKFELVDTDVRDDRAVATLRIDYDGLVAGYPFPFRMELQYALNLHEGFRCTTKIKNTGTEKMPIGDGWHPYFKMNGHITDFIIEMPPSDLLELDERLIPTGRLLKVEEQERFLNIGESDIDQCYKIQKNGSICNTKLCNSKTGCRVYLWQETGAKKYNYIQVYVPPSRQSIAIEPMSCAPNAYNNNQGLIVLEPGESFQAAYGIYYKNEPIKQVISR